MNKANSDFLGGLFTGLIITAVVATIIGRLCWINDNEGFENKLVIQYHNPHKKYDRSLILDMIDNSGITTNFINKKMTMTTWTMKLELSNPNNIHMTNPKND